MYCPKKFIDFPYVIEAKHYKEVKFNNLLTAKSHDIYNWWEQTCRETEQTNEYYNLKKKPLLIFKWDRSKDFCAWSDDILLTNQITINSFGHKFNIGLLSEWLKNSKISY